MGRRAKIDSKPTTTISIDIDTAEDLDELTTRGKTKNDIIKKLIDEHKELDYLKSLIKDRANITHFFNNIDEIINIFKNSVMGIRSDEIKNTLIEEKGFSKEQADFVFMFLLASNRLSSRGDYYELKQW